MKFTELRPYADPEKAARHTCWVCESHLDQPGDGPHACIGSSQCGAIQCANFRRLGLSQSPRPVVADSKCRAGFLACMGDGGPRKEGIEKTGVLKSAPKKRLGTLHPLLYFLETRVIPTRQKDRTDEPE
jgi:hypothetical protein